ncbi:TIR domain-containing protein [Ralstonia sp. 1B3]|uniref:TIR domain-containing protein n=1 Tax=Ralstonia sp. 1B3 TaxID=2997421 RepID=UPI002FCB30D2
MIDFRANVVRNHNITKDDNGGFFDASIWESARKQGDVALKRLINGGLENTSATVVLIGSQTYARRWVRYEVMRSIERGNVVLGIHINGIRDKYGKSHPRGPTLLII